MKTLPVFRFRSLVLVCLIVSCMGVVGGAAKPKKKKKPAGDKPVAAETKPAAAEIDDARRDRPPGAPNLRIPNPNATPAKPPAETVQPQVNLPDLP